jgi:hypothetical protein
MAALLVAETAVLAATLTKKGGAITAVKAVTQDTFVSTGSTFPVDVPGASVSMKVPSGQQGLFVIEFSAESSCSEPAQTTYICYVRVLVDGSPAFPGPMIFDTTDNKNVDALRANTVHWVVGPAGSGTHVIKVQYWVSSSAMTFFIRHPTLTVMRSKA